MSLAREQGARLMTQYYQSICTILSSRQNSRSRLLRVCMIDPQYSVMCSPLSMTAPANSPIPEPSNFDSLILILSSSESGQSQWASRGSAGCVGSDFILIIMGEFCYWDARSLGDTIILSVVLAAVVFIGFLTSSRLRKSRYFGEHGRKIIVIYLLVIAWTTVMSSQSAYSIYVFFGTLYQNPQQSIEPFARNYVRFDVLPGFIVQTIFLTICRYYYMGLTGAISVAMLSRWERSFITYLNAYFLLRVLAQAVGITLVNVFAETDRISYFSQVNLWILVVDSIIMNIYLILSLKIYLRAIRHTSMTEREIRTLKIEYSFMIATSLLRVVIDIIFVIMPLLDSAQEEACIVNNFSDHVMSSILYKVIGNLINQFIPIAFILKIYSYKSLESDTNIFTQDGSNVEHLNGTQSNSS